MLGGGFSGSAPTAAGVKSSIFQPFVQGKVIEHSPGLGIGLTLVARSAEMHGGRAWVQDRPNGGASFKVVLPSTAMPNHRRLPAELGVL